MSSELLGPSTAVRVLRIGSPAMVLGVRDEELRAVPATPLGRPCTIHIILSLALSKFLVGEHIEDIIVAFLPL